MKIQTLSLTIITALFSNVAMAEAWDITQTATITINSTTMLQKGGTNNSLQSINAINDSEIDVLTDSRQKVTQSTGTMSLQQEGTVSSSSQTMNYAKAKSIASGFTQDLTAKGTTLNQMTSGEHAIQGVNLIESTTGGIDAKQTITDTVSFKMMQTNTNTALQVGNGALSGTNTTNNKIIQDATVAKLEMIQGGTKESVQALNYVGITK
ncbi:MAG: hypothetical protein KAH03_05015 [Cocleimonas sp.]|nr:hypothetical protein [Cocleimonas sp.]